MRRKRGIQVAAVIMGVLLLAAGTVPVQAKTVSELEQEKQELESLQVKQANQQAEQEGQTEFRTAEAGQCNRDDRFHSGECGCCC